MVHEGEKEGGHSYTPFLYYLPVVSGSCFVPPAVEASVDMRVRRSDCKEKYLIVHVLGVDNSHFVLERTRAFSALQDLAHVAVDQVRQLMHKCATACGRAL